MQPNILLINLDDQPEWMMKADFAPKIIERLAQTGIRFNRAFANVPQCGPMRSLLLSGRYNHQSDQGPYNGVSWDYYRQIDHLDTIPVVLQSQGYRTGLFGKFMNGYGESNSTEISEGWSKWFAYTGGGDPGTWRASENGSFVSFTTHKDWQAEQKAKTWLDAKAPGIQPWFLYFALGGPHGPYPNDEAVTPIADRRGLYQNLTWDTPAHAEDTAAELADSPYLQPNAPYTDAEKAESLMHIRGKAREIRVCDDLVNDLLNKIASRGELGNTLVIVTADNGYLLGEYGGAFGKHEPYLQSSQIPLIVSGAGVGVQWWNVNPLVGHIDLAPTIVTAAGAQVPSRYDGRPLQPILDDGVRPDSWRDAMLIEQAYYGWKAMYDTKPGYGNRLYIRRENEADELYHLDTDPFTRENKYASRSQEVKDDLGSRLTSLVSCQGDTCRTREKV